MSVLIIDQAAQAAIKAAIERARDKPIPLDAINRIAVPKDQEHVALADRHAKHYRPQSEMVQLGSYRVAISFEEQPHGLVRHLSISAPKPGTVPNLPAIEMIAEEFGFAGGLSEWRAWLEEFEPGHHALNIAAFEQEIIARQRA